MPVYLYVLMIGFVGVVGGFINWLLSRPSGFYSFELLGNLLFGLLGPIMIIGLYSPLNIVPIAGKEAEMPTVGLVVSAAALGLGSARIWTSENIKRHLEATKAKESDGIIRLAHLLLKGVSSDEPR